MERTPNGVIDNFPKMFFLVFASTCGEVIELGACVSDEKAHQAFMQFFVVWVTLAKKFAQVFEALVFLRKKRGGQRAAVEAIKV